MSEAATEVETTTAETEEAVKDPQTSTESAEGQETEAKTTESTPSGDETAEREEVEHKRNRVQERISQLTNRAKEAESRAKELEEMIASLEGEQPEEKAMPKLEEFEYDTAAYEAALSQWLAEKQAQSVNVAMTQQQRWQVEQAQRQAVEAAKQAFTAKQEAFELDHPDFKQVVSNFKPNSPAIAQAVLYSENGPALAYHLAKNPGLSQSLESMNPIIAAMEIGAIQQKLSAPPPVNSSKAPPPADDLKPTGTVDKDPDKMTPAEYRAWRMKQRGEA